MGTDTVLFGLDHGVSAYEKVAAASISTAPQSAASFAMSALVNVGTCTLAELKSLVSEVARIARDIGETDPDVDASGVDMVVEKLDSAQDLIDEVHVAGESTCPTCRGSGGGRFEGNRCHSCGGEGGE